MRRQKCFVMMPFRGELNFFYLYLQEYLLRNYGLEVERGDHRVLTKPLMEKVREQILAADLVIAEVTGGNPNVFYELGLAHAYGKPVIFLTREDPSSAPVDIRQFEFIPYCLERHHELLTNLGNAIDNALAERWSHLYEAGCSLLQEFNRETGSSFQPVSTAEFRSRAVRGEQTEGLPDEGDRQQTAEFLLPKVLPEALELPVMRKLTEWIETSFK